MHSLPALCAASLLLSSPAQDSPQQKPLAEVRFTLYQNAVILPAVINRRDTVQLLLDTGWGPLALVSTAAQRLRLAVDPPSHGAFSRTRLASIAIGEAVQSNPAVEVFPTAALAPLIGPYDGVLSSDFFRDFVLQVDYPAGMVRFFRRSPIPAQPSASATRVSVPMRFSPRAGALPFTDSVYVDGRAVRGLFDTGGAGAFVAMRQLIERAGLRPIPDNGRIGIGMLSGDTMVRQAVHFARVGRVTIGQFTADSPRVMLAPPQLEGDNWGHDLVIGYGFLRQYIVTFNYPGKLITLERPVARQPT